MAILHIKTQDRHQSFTYLVSLSCSVLQWVGFNSMRFSGHPYRCIHSFFVSRIILLYSYPMLMRFFFGELCLAQVYSLSVVAALDFVPSSISQFVTSFNISCQSHPSHAIQSFWVIFVVVIWHLIGSLLANLRVAHRYLKKSRLFKFSHVPTTSTWSSKGILAAVTNSTNQTNNARGMRH